jgi:hypothetical protein
MWWLQGYQAFRLIFDVVPILTGNKFKGHNLKLEMVLASLSSAGMRINASKALHNYIPLPLLPHSTQCACLKCQLLFLFQILAKNLSIINP